VARRIPVSVLLSATEFWERFTYYGLRALLVLFLVAPVGTGGLGLKDADAASIYGLFAASAWLSGLPGGWIADRWLGAVRAIWAGGGLICMGNLLLCVAPTLGTVAGGLGLIVAGVGLLKPSALTLVARSAVVDSMGVDAAFTVVYTGINIGGIAGPLIGAALAATTGWRGGFAAAAIGMLIGLVVFQRVARRLPPTAAPTAAPTRSDISKILMGLVVMVTACVLVQPSILLRLVTVIVLVAAAAGFAVLARECRDGAERKRLGLFLGLFFGASLFWAAGEQAGASLTLFAERFTIRQVWGYTFPAPWYTALYPLWVVLLAPAFAWGWQRLATRNVEVPILAKFGAGLLLAALGLGLAAVAAQRASVAPVGPGWLAGTYLLIAVGDLFVAPTGLAAVTRLVPPGRAGFATGLFLLSLSLGGLTAGLTTSMFDMSRASGHARLLGTVAMVLSAAAFAFLLVGSRQRFNTSYAPKAG